MDRIIEQIIIKEKWNMNTNHQFLWFVFIKYFDKYDQNEKPTTEVVNENLSNLSFKYWTKKN